MGHGCNKSMGSFHNGGVAHSAARSVAVAGLAADIWGRGTGVSARASSATTVLPDRSAALPGHHFRVLVARLGTCS